VRLRPTRVVGLALVALLLAAGVAASLPPEDEDREAQLAQRFLEALEKAPHRGALLDKVYGHHVERGTLDGLLRRYQERTAKDANDGTAWMLLGLLEGQRGQDARAVAAFRRAEAARPADALVSYYLGQALVLVGKPDEAVEAFERALARKPANRQDQLEIFQALGRLHQRAQRTDKALDVWNRLEQLSPNDARVQEQIATVLAEEGQHAQALERFEKLAARTANRGRQAQYRLAAVDLKVRLGRSADALHDLEAMLGQLNSESWLYKEVRRKIEEVFLKNEDFAGLAKYYEDWLGKNPEDVDVMVRLSRSLTTQGRQAEAGPWLEKAVKLAPSRRDLRLALIEHLVHEQKTADALAQYEALDKAEPNNPDTLREWGRLLLQDTSRPEATRRQEAAAVWRRLTQARPRDPVTATQVADLCRTAGLTDEAVEGYRKAVELAPDAPQYREYLGEYYHTLKRSDEALAAWREMAAGPRRSAKNLGRLSEVLAGFGYLKEAIAANAEACDLAKDDFNLRLHAAELLHQAERYPDALGELDRAERLAANDEEAEGVLQQRLKTLQAANQLTAQADALQKELEAGKDASAARWYRLARYREADRRQGEAAVAIKKALAADERLVPAWTAAARIHEAAGSLLDAAAAQRRLADLDRRSRGEHIGAVARLEARLGRREQALEAGRQLLAADPNNPETYKAFAELCFQLGEAEEGLQTLRRAARVNPGETQVLLTLAGALADRFRTAEAIELYWRAFDRATALDDRLAVVPRLADLYLQTNQFDRLLERLQRGERDPDRPDRLRERTLCVAQAHQAAGDLGAARRELAALLGTNPRDTQLLRQLTGLAESENDLAAAISYQRQVVKVAPSKDEEGRLAQLLLRHGEGEEAGAVWARLAAQEKEATGILLAADHLLANGKADVAQTLAERLLRDHPRHWEALYRQGVALALADRPAEAQRSFQAILDLRLADDEPSLFQNQKTNKPPPQPARAGARAPREFPLEDRLTAVFQIQQAVGLLTERYYSPLSPSNRFWSPADFGQARLAALGWLLRLTAREKKQEDLVARMREGRDRDARAQLDWLYLQYLRRDAAGIYEASRAFARSADPALQWLYLTSLASRVPTRTPDPFATGPQRATDVTPLSQEEGDQMLACYRALRRQRPDWLSGPALNNVLTELQRAKRTADEEQVYREAVESADHPEALRGALGLAATRGDVDNVLKVFGRLEKLQGSQAVTGEVTQALGQVMGVRGAAKGHADVLRLLDHYLAYQRRQPRTTRPAAGTRSGPASRQYVSVWTGPSANVVALDYPLPNAYHDETAITLLRNAFEIYKRDDLLSDLFKHLRAPSEKAAGDEGAALHLAAGYLHWWNGEKAEALAELGRASDAVPGDLDLRLDVAELREQHGTLEDALALADSVTPLDHTSMQRRETLALRLAVRTGKVARARQAAERLFGLRLEPETQLQLAAQMRQLGMDALAEAVLSRARSQAGGRTAVLVSLMLQYQARNQPDTAAEVAYQILRHDPGTSGSRFGPDYEVQTARAQALQVLTRTGKLKELIARAEAQLKSSPQSVALHQTLADYYRAAGDKAKSREAYERLARLRPNDAHLLAQVAGQLYNLGEAKAAVEQYRVALKKEPTLFANQSFTILQAFRQADALDALAQLLDDMDPRALGASFNLMNTVSNLLLDEKTKAVGLRLFKKTWEAQPDQRLFLLQQYSSTAVWQLPEIYDYLRGALLIADDATTVDVWGAASAQTWDFTPDGRSRGGLFGRLLDTAAGQNRLDPLFQDVERALTKHPRWKSGNVLRAMLLARLGRMGEARRATDELLADKKEPMPATVQWFLGQELERYAAQRDLTLRLYEGATQDLVADGRVDFLNGPGQRLVELYREAKRDDDARALLLKVSRRELKSSGYPPDYAASRRLSELNAIASQFLQSGHPVEALRVYNDVLSDAARLELASRWFESRTAQATAEQGRGQALQALKPEVLPAALRELLTLREPHAGSKPTLDLLLLVYPADLPHATLTSVLARAVQLSAATPEFRPAVQEPLAALLKAHPDDVSVRTAAALAALAEEKPEAATAAVAALLELTERSPLEAIPAGARANARQREEAARQLGLWLVARECLKQKARRAAGEKLAARAVEAAARQADPASALAMWREWGQLDLDAGDPALAERRWARMLDLVLPASARPAAPAPVPLEQFSQAMNVARLAAEHGLHGLSLRAVRETLRGGPPLQLVLGDRLPAPRPSPRVTDPAAVARVVEASLGQLDGSWRQRRAPAAAVYEALAEVVFPEARPGEIFLYARPMTQSDVRRPHGAGHLLVSWAVEAGRADDLRRRLEALQDQERAALPARVLLAQLALATKNYPACRDALGRLDQHLQKDKGQQAAELACHAALPALAVTETSEAALPVLRRAVRPLASAASAEPAVSVLLLLARHDFAHGDVPAGRKGLQEYLELLNRGNVRLVADTLITQRKRQIQQAAAEFIQAGLLADALEALAQFADMARPSGGESVLARLDYALYRQLLARPAKERYELLRTWMMPTPSRKAIRLYGAYLPTDEVPAAFAPLRGAAGGPAAPGSQHPLTEGILDFTTLLLDAAREVGKLDELAAEAGKAAEDKAVNGEYFLIRVELARGRAEAVEPRLKKLRDALVAPATPGTTRNASWEEFQLTCACLADPRLRPLGEDMARHHIVTLRPQNNSWAFLSHFGCALALARAVGAGEVRDLAGRDSGLARWHPSRLSAATYDQYHFPDTWWAAQDGYIVPLASRAIGGLYYDYPLTGRFEFSVDDYIEDWAEGQVGYGGVVFMPGGAGMYSGFFPVGLHEVLRQPCAFVRPGDFNRLTLQVEPGKVRVLINGHLFCEDADPSPTSPWLMLHDHWTRRPAYRNSVLTGTPQVPRSVPLSHADRLEGWVSSFYTDTQPPRRSLTTTSSASAAGQTVQLLPGPDAYDWSARDGVIHGRRLSGAPEAEPVQSVLRYHRPLRDGEALRYEFYYEPGAVMVHPALDRLVFLLEPDGVRLHWMTGTAEDDWTGLRADNAVAEPDNRRGPEQLPLKAGAWNTLQLALDGGRVTLLLNDAKVYERPLESTNDRIIGLFHYKDRTSVQIRNVALQGNWPEKLTGRHLADLAAPAEAAPGQPDARARGALVGEAFLSHGAADVLRRARGLPPAERYASLRAWVLPGPEHSAFRLYGDFSPTDRAPDPPADRSVPRTHTPGHLEAPALELVAVAKQLGKLDELAEAVAKGPAETAPDRRARLALLSVVQSARGRTADAVAALKDLLPLLAAVEKGRPAWERWPEFVAASAALERPELRPAGMVLLDEMAGQLQKLTPTESAALGFSWPRYVTHLRARGEVAGLPEAEGTPFGADPKLAYWSRVEHAIGATRGRGMGVPHWLVRDGTATHYPGHGDDYLYFRVPLRGSFEASCELTASAGRQACLAYAGYRVEPAADGKSFQLSLYDRPLRSVAVTPPLKEPPEGWRPCRLVVKESRLSVYLDGRKLHEEQLPAEADPWLTLHVRGVNTGGMHNLKITGRPVVLEALSLSAAGELLGWQAHYYGEAVGGAKPAWEKRGDEIVGPVVKEAAGSYQESLLQYHRPLLEDGSVEYEFYYEPGAALVHPALDRLAFLLAPEGVKVHWLTDGAYERAGLAPDNATAEPENRRGPEKLPLRERDWNRLRLSLTGDRVTLRLNDVEVYQRTVEPTNQRIFALFHYADATEVRVRNVRYIGEWPRELPAADRLWAKAALRR
jgi:tetratricopeptide (TPR) repeat protein